MRLSIVDWLRVLFVVETCCVEKMFGWMHVVWLEFKLIPEKG